MENCGRTIDEDNFINALGMSHREFLEQFAAIKYPGKNPLEINKALLEEYPMPQTREKMREAIEEMGEKKGKKKGEI